MKPSKFKACLPTPKVAYQFNRKVIRTGEGEQISQAGTALVNKRVKGSRAMKNSL